MKATNRLTHILMRRDGMERDDAEDLLRNAREAVEEGEDPEEILAEKTVAQSDIEQARQMGEAMAEGLAQGIF